MTNRFGLPGLRCFLECRIYSAKKQTHSRETGTVGHSICRTFPLSMVFIFLSVLTTSFSNILSQTLNELINQDNDIFGGYVQKM